MREIDGFYGEVHNDLKALIGEIDVKNGELSKVREGKTSVKRKGIEELIASIVPVANATKAYAVRKKKIELKALTDFSERQFKRLSHAELPIKVKNIKDAAQGVITDLANYGMTQADLDLVDEKLASLKASVENKDTGFTDHVALREALYGLFDSADDLLNEEADSIVEVLKKTKLDFYNQYFAARVVKNLGGSRGGGDNPQEPPAPPEQPK
ncbi:MAG: hypothetical protein COZ80_10030 [Ignavibacteria bacterium CG_4_8_14_3_um_filter_37_9]|nr:MAG: hypothetical protein COZ80_10030 [Ignavibacteria bacterium CG_4_8_14_3_um_filter_37_9]